jgi:hypothetical protein
MAVAIKWFNRIAIALLILVLAYRGLDWMTRHAKNLPPVPQQNGYDALFAAAKAVSIPSGELIDVSESEIRKLADQNKLALTNALKAFDLESKVPLKTGKGWLDSHQDDLKTFKRLAMGFGMESRVQNLNGETNAEAALSIIRLGQTLCHGGMIPDAAAGLPLEVVGDSMLQSQLNQFDAAQCRQIAQTLERWESQRETTQQILETDTIWFTVQYGLISRLSGMHKGKRQQEFTVRYNGVRNMTGQLMLRAANRAYLLDNGKAPTSNQDLIPAYLKATPLDAATGKPLDPKPAE